MLILNGPFNEIMLSKRTIFLLLLAVAIVGQSLCVIYSKQSQRELHAKLQANYKQRDKLHQEWSQLLLEKGTWQADARVEKIAREQLGMVVPEKVEVIAP